MELKDATGDLSRVDKCLKLIGKEFVQLTGEDHNVLEFNKRGGRGCISVTANVATKLCAEFQNESLKNNESDKAKEINKMLQPLHKALFIESNPTPVKYAASLLKLSPASVRLPLVEVEENTKSEIEKALKIAKLL